MLEYIIRASIALCLIGGLIYATRCFLKYGSNPMGVKKTQGHIQIIERTAVGRDQFLAIATIDKKAYFIAISPSGIQLLDALPDFSWADTATTTIENNSFGKSLAQAIKEMNLKGNKDEEKVG